MLTLMMALSGPVHAAPAPAVPYPHARRTRDVGIAVTVPGLILAAGGGAIVAGGLISDARPCDPDIPCEGWGSVAAFGGLVIAGTSLPFLAVGLPMWVGGNQRLHQNRLVVTALPLREGGMVGAALTF